MKLSSKLFGTMCASWPVFGFLCGCASDHSKPATNIPSSPDNSLPGQPTATSLAMTTTGTPPLAYQWYTGTNTSLVTNYNQSATFSVVASTNEGPLYYQWQFNGANISGVTNH